MKKNHRPKSAMPLSSSPGQSSDSSALAAKPKRIVTKFKPGGELSAAIK